jgi:hypothetical protein
MRNIRLDESLSAHGYGRMNSTDMHVGIATTETIDRLAARAALGLPLFPDLPTGPHERGALAGSQPVLTLD